MLGMALTSGCLLDDNLRESLDSEYPLCQILRKQRIHCLVEIPLLQRLRFGNAAGYES